jgi:hypothetical protein
MIIETRTATMEVRPDPLNPRDILLRVHDIFDGESSQVLDPETALALGLRLQGLALELAPQLAGRTACELVPIDPDESWAERERKWNEAVAKPQAGVDGNGGGLSSI